MIRGFGSCTPASRRGPPRLRPSPSPEARRFPEGSLAVSLPSGPQCGVEPSERRSCCGSGRRLVSSGGGSQPIGNGESVLRCIRLRTVEGTRVRLGPRLRLLTGGAVALATSLSCGSVAPQTAPSTAVSTVASPIEIAQPWVTASATDAGLDPAKLSQAVADASAIPRLQSFLIVRHGKLVSETYLGGTDASTPFDVRSATKSVLSLLVGQAIDEGVLPGLDTTIGSYLGSPYVLDSGDASVTVRELLTMSSGYEWNEWTGNDYNLWIESSNHVQYLLDRPQTTPPAGFTYDSAAVHVLGVTLQAAAKTYLPDLAQARLFGPIGVTSASWELLDRHTVN